MMIGIKENHEDWDEDYARISPRLNSGKLAQRVYVIATNCLCRRVH